MKFHLTISCVISPHGSYFNTWCLFKCACQNYSQYNTLSSHKWCSVASEPLNHMSMSTITTTNTKYNLWAAHLFELHYLYIYGMMEVTTLLHIHTLYSAGSRKSWSQIKNGHQHKIQLQWDLYKILIITYNFMFCTNKREILPVKGPI